MNYFNKNIICGKIDLNTTQKLTTKIANAIVLYYKKYKFNNVILVGNDGKIKNDYILSILASTLLKNGIEIHNIGICSSPCLAFTTKKFNYSLGIMLTTSQNNNDYIGIKFFNNLGEKVDNQFEKEFEILMNKKPYSKHKKFASLKIVENIKQDYISYLKSLKKSNIPCIFDCSNIVTREICNALFPKQEKINFHKIEYDINSNLDYANIEMLKSQCIKKQTIGFSFNEDGEKILVVDTNGNIINQDKILYILSKFYLKKNSTLIGTSNTNLELEHNLKHINISLIRADNNKVQEYMQKHSSNLSIAENNTIILKTQSSTADGVLVAIMLLNILNLTKQTFKQLLSNYKEIKKS